MHCALPICDCLSLQASEDVRIHVVADGRRRKRAFLCASLTHSLWKTHFSSKDTSTPFRCQGRAEILPEPCSVARVLGLRVRTPAGRLARSPDTILGGLSRRIRLSVLSKGSQARLAHRPPILGLPGSSSWPSPCQRFQVLRRLALCVSFSRSGLD